MSSGSTLTTQFDAFAQLAVPVVLVELAGTGTVRAWCNAPACALTNGETPCSDGWTDIDVCRLEAAGISLARVCASLLTDGAPSIALTMRRAGIGKPVRFTFSKCCLADAKRIFAVGIGAELAIDDGSGPEVHRTLAEIESLALIGHYVEHRDRGQVEWSPGLERLRCPASTKGPVTFQDLAETIYPEDAVSLAAREADEQWQRASMEFRVIRSDGSIRNIYRHCLRDFSPDGSIVRVLGIEQDITDFREVERALTEASVASEAASKSKAEFLAHMSHELRTPLNAIKGFSEVMAQQLFGPLSERYLDYVNQVHKSAEDLWLRIDYILDLARIEDGQYELGKESVDLGSIAAEVTDLLRRRADEKNISVEMRPGGPEHFWAEKRALKTIVYNLLDNALKFTGPGGSVRVETGVTSAGKAFLRVRDNGVGIPERDIKRVCDPFFQSRAGVEEAGESGTGLGLAITKSLVDLHEGRIDITSEVGSGSTFTVLMPMRDYSPGRAPLTGVRLA